MTMTMLVISAAVSVLLALVGVTMILRRDSNKVRRRVRVLAGRNRNQVSVGAPTAPSLPLAITQITEWAVGPSWMQQEKARSLLLGISRMIEWVAGPAWNRKMTDLLAGADVPLRPGEYIAFRVALAALGALAGLLLPGAFWVALALTAAAYMVPAAYVRWRRRRRQLRFQEQLPYMLQLVVSSLCSGSSLEHGFKEAAQICQPPIRKELEIVLRELNLGLPLDEALKSMARRAGSSDFDMVTLACRIQREAGGSLTAVLNKVAETVRIRLQLRGELRTLTAQGRLSTLIIGLLPIAVFIAVIIISPTYFTPLLNDWFGRSILIGVLVWQAIGMLVIWKIVNVRIKI